MNKKNLVIFVLLLSFTISGHAAVPGNRTALVIGNASYAMMPLDNPVNDARSMSSALKETGFQVISVFDADLQAMQSAMLQFTASLNQDSTELVYYAGHGILTRLDGENIRSAESSAAITTTRQPGNK